jgi:Domain of unknown function (DUF4395)
VTAKSLFAFPHPVNEVSARLVAAGVLLMALAALVLQQPWITLVLAYGFIARVLTGPTLSPLGLLVTKVVVPRLDVKPKYVAGPPKRFAQGIGAVVTTAAAISYFAFGNEPVTYVLLGAIALAATLESVFAVCIGCILFGQLMRWNVIPERVCEACNDLGLSRTGA